MKAWSLLSRHTVFAVLAAWIISWLALPALAQTVDEAVAAAIDYHPSIDRAEADVKAARAGARRAVAEYRPNVSFEASASASKRDARLRDLDSFEETSAPVSAAIVLEQQLYTNGLRPLARKRALIDLRSRSHQLYAAEQSIALEVVLELIRLQQARDYDRTQTALANLIQSQLMAERERFRLSTGTRTNIAQAEARMASVEVERDRAGASIEESLEALGAMTGLEFNPYSPSPGPPPLPVSLEEAIELAVTQSPQIAMAQDAESGARIDMVRARRRFGPQVGVSVQASSANRPSPAIERDDEVRATLSLSVPLYSGGRKSAAQSEAAAIRSAAVADRRQTEDELVLRIKSLWRNAESAQRQRAASTIRWNASQEALEGVRQGHAAGLWTITDILDAMEETIAAEQAITEADAAILAAKWEIAIVSGTYALSDMQ